MGLWTGAFLAGTMAAAAAWAGDDCTVPMADWQPRTAVEALADARGWTIRRLGIDDGCYEIDGWDSDGRAVEIKLDPGTLAVVELDFEDERPRPLHGNRKTQGE